MAPNYFTQRTLISVVRIITGLMMVYHGIEVFDHTKMAEYAKWDSFKNMNGLFMTYLGKGAELVAGAMLVLGFYTRVASIIMIGTMAYIAFFIGHGKVWYEDQHPFMFVLIGFIFYALGGTKWSVDEWLLAKKEQNK
jgi:putative oxidoreductase